MNADVEPHIHPASPTSLKNGGEPAPDETAESAEHQTGKTKQDKRLRADKPAQALHSQWAQEDASRTARQREADRDRWRDV